MRRVRAICFSDKARQNFLELIQQLPVRLSFSFSNGVRASSRPFTRVRHSGDDSFETRPFHVVYVSHARNRWPQFVKRHHGGGDRLSRGLHSTLSFSPPGNIKIPAYLFLSLSLSHVERVARKSAFVVHTFLARLHDSARDRDLFCICAPP